MVTKSRGLHRSLHIQVLAGIVIGIALGVFYPQTGEAMKPFGDGFIKLVADTDRGILVGATSAGPMGGEVLGLLALAVHAAVPTATLRQMIYAYPTFHRAIEAALDDLT